MSNEMLDRIRKNLPKLSGDNDIIEIIDPKDLRNFDSEQLAQIVAVNNILEPSGMIQDISNALDSSIKAQGEALKVEKTSNILAKLPQSPTTTASNAVSGGALRKTTTIEKRSSTFNKFAGFLKFLGIDIGEPKDTKYTRTEINENFRGKAKASDPSVNGGKKRVSATFSSHNAAGAGFDNDSSVTSMTNEHGASSKLKGRGVIGASTITGSASGSNEEPSVRGGRIIYKSED